MSNEPGSMQRTTVVRQKPLMNMRQILLMNFGFFGIQYSFGMQQTAVNPIYTFLGANPHDLPIMNLAGPVTGLLIQPLIGALSDGFWHPKWGRRKLFFIIGAAGCSICLFFFPFVTAIWTAVLLLWLLDASNNTAMEPYRAFIADRLPPSQLGKGFLAQSFFTGLGITLANLSLFFFQMVIQGATEAGIPYWVVGSFMLGAVFSIGSVLLSVLTTPELPPTDAELAALRANKRGLRHAFKEIWDAIVDMPVELRKLALVYLFQWYGMVCYWQFVTLSIAQSAFGITDHDDPKFAEAVAWTGMVNGFYNIVTFSVAFLLVRMARQYGAKWVHAGSLLLACVGLIWFPHINNQYLMLVPMIGLGIAWASIMGVPYILAVRVIPSTRYGVYMGVINMMIVVPMIIQNLTFGPIFVSFGEDPTFALTVAGVLLGVAALAMTWIKEPPMVRDVEDLSPAPMGAH